jgi:hypothetical protein
MPISRSLMERQLRMGGGIMNVAPRQGALLGGLKKAVKGVAKGIGSILKSDVGKLALLAGTYKLGGGKLLGGEGFAFGNLPGASFFTSGTPLQQTGKVFLGGSLLGGVLGEMSPEEQAEITSGRNIDALKIKLADAYRNQRTFADAENEDAAIAEQVEKDVSEYTSGAGGYAEGGRIGYDNGGYTFEQFMKDKGKVDQFMGEQEMRKLYEKMMREKKVREQKTMAAEGGRIGYSDGTSEPEYGTKEYFKKNLDDLKLDELIEKPSLLLPFTIGMIEERLEQYDKVGGDITPYLNKYNIIKQKNAEYFQGLSEKEKEDYIKRRKDALQEDLEMGIFPGQDKLGIIGIEKETDSGVKIPAPEKDRFDIEGFKKYRMDAATGGRMSYAMGTDDKVMMAAGIMGLPQRTNAAGVKELDLRKSGGFIPPVGVKEKADDIPAMLSNNEFVFTADAVRGMGDGNVNKGAQRMYDMMKSLENKVV